MSEERSSPVDRLLGAIVPRAVDSIDPDALIDRLDVDGLVERVDVDALIQRVDVDGLIQRVDVDGLIRRVDLDDLLARIDVQGLLDRIDLARLLDRIDMDGLIRKVDLDALLATVDLDALIARLDVDALVARLDVNALVGRLDLDQLLTQVDVKALVDRAGIDAIVAEATTGVAARTLDLARRQVVGLDLILLGGVDRALRRPKVVVPADADLSPTGRPGGPVARLLAFVLDSLVVSTTFTIGVTIGRALVELLTRQALSDQSGQGPLWGAVFLAWWFLYLWTSFVVAGKTPGKALVGLRVTALDGTPLRAGRALLRVVTLPLSMVAGLGLIPAVLRRDRRALHDLVAGSQEVIDWGDRRAALPSTLQRWVETHRTELPDPGAPETTAGDAAAVVDLGAAGQVT